MDDKLSSKAHINKEASKKYGNSGIRYKLIGSVLNTVLQIIYNIFIQSNVLI